MSSRSLWSLATRVFPRHGFSETRNVCTTGARSSLACSHGDENDDDGAEDDSGEGDDDDGQNDDDADETVTRTTMTTFIPAEAAAGEVTSPF